MLILLPPSEGKSIPSRGKRLALETLSFPELTSSRRHALEALTTLCAADIEAAATILGLGTTQQDEVRRNQRLTSAPTARADAIYTGVLYDSLDLASLGATARRRAGRSLLVTSSLFGLLRPADRIPSYRLAGNVKLPGLGVVAKHWRGVLDPMLHQAAGSRLVVDLRSTTYAAFWRPGPDLAAQVATVRVLVQVGSERKVVSHFNKATKGRLVRALLESGSSPATPGQLADQLTTLGWKVELQAPGRYGQQLDVIIDTV